MRLLLKLSNKMDVMEDRISNISNIAGTSPYLMKGAGSKSRNTLLKQAYSRRGNKQSYILL